MLPSTAAHVLASDSSTKEQKSRASRALNNWRKVRACLIGLGLIAAGVFLCYAAMRVSGWEHVPAEVSK